MKYFLLVITIALCSLQLAAQSQTQPSTQTAPLKIINFKKLQEFLPTKAPEGFTRQKPKGQTMSSSGISSSNASVEFTSPKKIKELQTMDDGKQDSVEVDVTWSATIDITDYAGMGEGMSAALQMIGGMEFENETENGYEKSVKFKDYKGIEKVSSQENSNSCSLQLVVGNRFLVNANGNNFADVTILHSLLNSMDMKKLEQTK
ncbi:MAG TPA: hypothetical protein DCQ28_03990 [Bacteroidetes bacterium]|nr:hypothetical protein [Bacteroidota bacterium]